jgi:hypothetical protein
MKAALDYLVRRGLRRGLLGGETVWLVLGGGALAVRLAARALRKKDDLVFSEKLGQGESLVITHRAPTELRKTR